MLISNLSSRVTDATASSHIQGMKTVAPQTPLSAGLFASPQRLAMLGGPLRPTGKFPVRTAAKHSNPRANSAGRDFKVTLGAVELTAERYRKNDRDQYRQVTRSLYNAELGARAEPAGAGTLLRFAFVLPADAAPTVTKRLATPASVEGKSN